MKETKTSSSKEYSPREIFDVVKESGAVEYQINPDKKIIKIENRLDLYKVLRSFKLITYELNGNNHKTLDSDGVPQISKSRGIKFINTHDTESPYHTHPVVAKIGEKDSWTIIGAITKAKPNSSR